MSGGLLEGAHYETRFGEFDLLNPLPCGADDAITATCRRFEESSAEVRALMRERVSEDDFYALMRYSSRRAVFAVRGNDTRAARDAFIAAVVVRWDAFDFRDYSIEAPQLAAAQIGLDTGGLLREAAAMADPGTSKTVLMSGRFRKFRRLFSRERERFVKTKFGWGLLPWYSRVSRGILGLLPAAISVGEAVEATKRYTVTISGDSEVPAVWFRDSRATSLLRRARSVVEVRGRIEPGIVPGEGFATRFPWIACWIAEMPDQETSDRLRELAASARDERSVILGHSSHRLFALTVATSSVQGMKPVETLESLTGVGQAIQGALERGTSPKA